MLDFVRILGDKVKQARERLGLTQKQVAEQANVDNRTVLNIENYKGNPKFEVLCPIIRTLKIDPREIFYPELHRDTPAVHQLRMLIEDCDEEEAQALIAVVQSVLKVSRSKRPVSVK